MEIAKAPDLIPQPKTPSVNLIVTSPEGVVLGMTGGVNPILSAILSERLKEDVSPIRKIDVLQPLGQDCYEASREFAIAVSGAFMDMTWPEVQSLLKTFPNVAKFTFVVSY